MQNSDFKGALFDLDGTLADNYTAIHRCTSAAFESFGFPAPSYEKLVKTVGGSILITMKRLLADTEFADMYEKTAELYMRTYSDYVFCGLRAMPFAEDVLKALRARGLKLGCFTNKQREGADAVLRKLGLFGYFDSITATTLHSARKPDAEFSRAALASLGLSASEVVCVGDSPFDYAAAENVGAASALVATGGDSRETLLQKCPAAIGVFDNLKQLSAAVFGAPLE